MVGVWTLSKVSEDLGDYEPVGVEHVEKENYDSVTGRQTKTL